MVSCRESPPGRENRSEKFLKLEGLARPEFLREEDRNEKKAWRNRGGSDYAQLWP